MNLTWNISRTDRLLWLTESFKSPKDRIINIPVLYVYTYYKYFRGGQWALTQDLGGGYDGEREAKTSRFILVAVNTRKEWKRKSTLLEFTFAKFGILAPQLSSVLDLLDSEFFPTSAITAEETLVVDDKSPRDDGFCTDWSSRYFYDVRPCSVERFNIIFSQNCNRFWRFA